MDGNTQSNNQQSGISLVIPAFNEAAGIAEMIAKADKSLETVGSNYEIIVVDDGSSDSTFEIAQEASKHRSNVQVIRHESNRGYGAAIRTGFAACNKELVVFTDADCQFDLAEMPRFTLLAEDYDVVCGYRIDRKDPWIRKTYSKVYNLLVRTLLGTQVRDIDCAFKMFHRRDLEKLSITTDGFLINTEMLTKAKQNELSVVEVGVTHLPRVLGQSTVSAAHILPVLIGLIRFWWNRVLFAGSTSVADPSDETKSVWKWAFPAIALLAAIVLFTNLGYPLIDRDETRYAEIPREMLVTGDWISPQLNFEPYYDKPPLLYWLCAASYKTFGVSEWSARLVPAMSALLLLLATMCFGARMFGKRVGMIGGLVLLVTTGFVFSGRFLLIDGLLGLLVAISMFASYESIRSGSFRWRWWIASAVFCGLGVLAKGPIAGVLLGPPVLAFAWLTQSSAKIRFRDWVAFAAVVFAVASPWFLLAASHDSQFLYEFFVNHNVSRFAGAYHTQPFWYFGPVALVGGHPWTFLLIPYAMFLSSRGLEITSRRPPAQAFLLLWVVWCVAFFSLSKCKLGTYIIPTAPAFALLVAHYLDHAIFRSDKNPTFAMGRWLSPRMAIYTNCIVGISMGVAAIWVTGTPTLVNILSIVLWVAAAIVAFVVLKTSSCRVSWSICTVLALLMLMQSSQTILPLIGRSHMMVVPSQELAELSNDPELKVATFAHEWSGIPFYSNRNDIRNFKGTEWKQLSEFLTSNRSTLVIVRGEDAANGISQLLPADFTLRPVISSGSTRVLMAEKAASTAAAESPSGTRLR